MSTGMEYEYSAPVSAPPTSTRQLAPRRGSRVLGGGDGVGQAVIRPLRSPRRADGSSLRRPRRSPLAALPFRLVALAVLLAGASACVELTQAAHPPERGAAVPSAAEGKAPGGQRDADPEHAPAASRVARAPQSPS